MTASIIIKMITVFLILINVATSQSQATKRHSKKAAAEASAPNSPSPNNYYSPIQITHHHDQTLSPEYMEFLKSCQSKITIDCADQVSNELYNNKPIPNNQCCKQLVEMGPDCHKSLVERQTALIKMENLRKKVVSRREDLWRRCERVAPRGSPKKGHYPRLPPPEFLPGGYDSVVKDCKAKLTENCGTEIVGVIVDRSKDWWAVGGDCCRQVVRMGVECHVALLDNLAKDHKDDQGYIKDKGNHVWKHCVVSQG